MKYLLKLKKGDISLLVTLLVCSILLLLLAPLAQKILVESKISRENLMSQQAIQAAKTGLEAWKYNLTEGKIDITDTSLNKDWPNFNTSPSVSKETDSNNNNWIILDSNLGIQYRVEFISDSSGSTPSVIIGKGRVKKGDLTIERTFEETFITSNTIPTP